MRQSPGPRPLAPKVPPRSKSQPQWKRSQALCTMPMEHPESAGHCAQHVLDTEGSLATVHNLAWRAQAVRGILQGLPRTSDRLWSSQQIQWERPQTSRTARLDRPRTRHHTQNVLDAEKQPTTEHIMFLYPPNPRDSCRGLSPKCPATDQAASPDRRGPKLCAHQVETPKRNRPHHKA